MEANLGLLLFFIFVPPYANKTGIKERQEQNSKASHVWGTQAYAFVSIYTNQKKRVLSLDGLIVVSSRHNLLPGRMQQQRVLELGGVAASDIVKRRMLGHQANLDQLS